MDSNPQNIEAKETKILIVEKDWIGIGIEGRGFFFKACTRIRPEAMVRKRGGK